jgi:carbonic anhydrase
MNTSKSARQAFNLWICVCFAVAAAIATASEPTSVSADDGLKRLLNGNAQFVVGKSAELNGPQLIERRTALAKDQKPFAVIVSCSDSRVPPEFIFNVGLGDVFVVRTAGEVVDSVALGSIEYAVEHLGASLIVVLGHQRCGAVAAAVSGANEPGDIPAVLKAIAPAVEETKGKPGDPIDNAVRANAVDIAKRLQSTGPIIAPRVQSRKVTVLAARYDLESGKVELLNQ